MHNVWRGGAATMTLRAPSLSSTAVLSLLLACCASHLARGITGDGAASSRWHAVSRAPLDVWILAGQSNMEGQNSRDGQTMPDCGIPWPDRILSYPKANAPWQGNADTFPASQWIPAQPNTCRFSSSHILDNTSMGPEMAFAKTLLRAGASRRIGFVPMTAGGSSLFQDWAAPWSAQHGLSAILVMLAKQAMQSAGEGARLAGMIWVQGEGDATIMAGAANAAQYERNLVQLLGTIRRSLFHLNPLLPIIMGVQATSERDRVFPHINAVRQQQLGLNLPALLKVDMEGFEMMADNFTDMFGPGVGVQKVHLTKNGQCAFGEALANAYLSHHMVLDRELAAAKASESMMHY